MTIERMKRKFFANGYKIGYTWTGNVLITKPNGRYAIFENLTRAYNFYFA